MNKKTLWIILGITSNAIFLIGLLLIIVSFKYDTHKEYAYTETTSINIQKDDKITANERPLDDSQEHDNRVNKDNKDYATNNTNDYVVKTTITKSTYNNNNKNNSNDNKNYSNTNTNNSNNKNDSNNSNSNCLLRRRRNPFIRTVPVRVEVQVRQCPERCGDRS